MDIMLSLAEVANDCTEEAFATLENTYRTSDGKGVAQFLRVSTCDRLKPVVRTRMGVVLWSSSRMHGAGVNHGPGALQACSETVQYDMDLVFASLMKELHGECDALLAEMEDECQRCRARTGGWSLKAHTGLDLPCSFVFDAHWGLNVAMVLQFHTPLSSPPSLQAVKHALRRPPGTAAVQARAAPPLAAEADRATTDDPGAALPLLASCDTCVLTGVGTVDRRPSPGGQTLSSANSTGTIGRLGGAISHTW